MESEPRPETAIESALRIAVEEGRMSKKEAQECYDAYLRNFHPGENTYPIFDDDPLAGPIGYYEEPPGLWD